MYAISLLHCIKKRRFNNARTLLNFINCPELASNFASTDLPSKTWLYSIDKISQYKISSPQQIEFDRRHSCNVPVIYFYMELHEHLFRRDSRFILSMDETMLTAKRRLKVLARKWRLPLMSEAVKFPHLTGCVTFTASGDF